MNTTDLLRREDAVSPVIGVILMVAITVILAAVIGTFALGFTTTDDSPTASWDPTALDETDNGTVDNVTIEHLGGSKIQGENLEVVVGSDSQTLSTDIVGVGDEIEVELDESTTRPSGDELQLVWTSPDSGESYVLVSHEFTSQYGGGIDSVSV